MASPLIVFDLDGTLVDSNRDLVPALNAATSTCGLPPVGMDQVGHVVGLGAREMIKKAFSLHGRTLRAPLLDELFAVFIDHYSDHIADLSEPYPGTVAMLDRFSRAGWTLAVCTNKLEHLSNSLLDSLGMKNHFSIVAGADTFNIRKPDPGHLHMTIDAAGGQRDNSLFVGDSTIDRETAIRAEIPFVGVTFGYTTVPMVSLNPDLLIGHYDLLTAESAADLIRTRARP